MKIPALLCLVWPLLPGALQAQTLADGLDQPSLTVTGGVPWQHSADPALTHDGADSAICSLTAGTPSQVSLKATVTGPARIAWWWRKTGTGVGTIESRVGGRTIYQLGGSAQDWARAEVTVPAGTHELVWNAQRGNGDVSYAVDELGIQTHTGRGLASWRDAWPVPQSFLGTPYEPAAVSVTVAAGFVPNPVFNYYYAIRRDGTVASWGDASAGSVVPPAGLTNVAAIAASDAGAIALHKDGTVTGWGSATPVPAGITNAVQVAAGREHYLVLRSDGHVTAWGSIVRNSFGPQGNLAIRTPVTIPAELPRLTQVKCAGSWSFGLTVDGRVVRWNDTNSYQFLQPADDLPQRVSAFTVSTDLLSLPVSFEMPVLSGLTFDGQAVGRGLAAPYADNVTSVVQDPFGFGTTGNKHMWALRRDGTLTDAQNPPVTVAGISMVAALDVSLTSALAITGDASQPPEFVSPGSALAFAAPSDVAAARVWYPCAVVNGAQTYSADALPPGLALDAASGRVFGQPTLTGTYDVTFTAANDAGQGQKTVRFYVETTPIPLVNGGERTVAQDAPFTHSITPSGAPAAANYAVINPVPWITLDPVTGLLSGNPPLPGVFFFTLKAASIAGVTYGTLKLTVTPAVPVVSGTTVTVREGAWFYHQISATGLPHTAWDAAPLPAGLTHSGGVISGKPSVPGEYDITLSTTNSAGTGTATLHLEVLPRVPVRGLIVTTTADELDTPAGAAVSLREALRDVPGGGTVQFAPALRGQTITLTQGPLVLNGVSREATIRAAVPGVTVSGGNASRIFEIGAGARLHVEGLTLRDGHAPNATASTGANTSSISGGAVFSAGFFTAANCLFLNNTAGTGFTDPVLAGQNDFGPPGGPGGSGGAVHSTGPLELLRCRFTGNQAGRGGNGGAPGENRLGPGPGGSGGQGGAIRTNTVTAVDCEFVSNMAGGGGDGGPPRLPTDGLTGTGGNGGDGGAIFASSAVLRNCALIGNQSGAFGPAGIPGRFVGIDGGVGSGGGLFVITLDMVNCTLVNNLTAATGSLTPSAGYAAGGAIAIATGGTGRIVHCTITGNAIAGSVQSTPAPASARGGGISGSAGLIIENSIVAANTALFADGHDIFGGLTYTGANLIGVLGTTAGPLNGTPAAPLIPGFSGLTWNGGPARTMRLTAGSPALDAALVSPTTPVTDQRGYPRTAGSAPDLGALEMETTPVAALMVGDLTLTAETSGYALRWGIAAGSYTVQQSTTLDAGSWVPVPGLILIIDPDSAAAVAIFPANQDPRRCFRVVWSP